MDLPEHEAVILALSALDYEFDEPAKLSSGARVLGYAPGSVVEVIEGRSATVSLLFSADSSDETLVSTTMAVVAVAAATRVQFLDWLATQMRTRGQRAPWKATRRFARRRVSARYLDADAMLLTIEGQA